MKKFMLVVFTVFLFLVGCSSEEPVLLEAGNGELEKSSNYPDRILLPGAFEPEGIATGKGSTFYVGSLISGEIFKGDYRTGSGDVFVEASSRLAFGLSYDERTDYLYVAGGPNGLVYVYDGTTGDIVEEINVPGGIFINDIVVTRDAVYMTESLGAVFYKLELGAGGEIISTTAETINLTGDYDFIENAPTPYGLNNNGIAASANGKYLVIGNMADGNLYRVDPETGHAELINLGGDTVPFNDGLIIQGNTLYAVQNIISQVSVVDLSSDFLTGEIERVITSSLFEVPATGTLFGNSLYLVNARFTLPAGPYYVVKVSK